MMFSEYEAFWKNCFDFYGRTSRRSYLTVLLINFLIGWGLNTLARSIGIFSVAAVVYSIVASIPNLSIAVRRLHDVGKKGIWLFIAFVPVIGPIWLIILLLAKSEGKNAYGYAPQV